MTRFYLISIVAAAVVLDPNLVIHLSQASLALALQLLQAAADLVSPADDSFWGRFCAFVTLKLTSLLGQVLRILLEADRITTAVGNAVIQEAYLIGGVQDGGNIFTITLLHWFFRSMYEVVSILYVSVQPFEGPCLIQGLALQLRIIVQQTRCALKVMISAQWIVLESMAVVTGRVLASRLMACVNIILLLVLYGTGRLIFRLCIWLMT